MTDQPKNRTGGPAFPAYEHYVGMEPGSSATVKVITGKPQGGMTLRDYAEIKFIAAMLHDDGYGNNDWPGNIVQDARKVATEWLAQREKEAQ